MIIFVGVCVPLCFGSMGFWCRLYRSLSPCAYKQTHSFSSTFASLLTTSCFLGYDADICCVCVWIYRIKCVHKSYCCKFVVRICVYRFWLCVCLRHLRGWWRCDRVVYILCCVSQVNTLWYTGFMYYIYSIENIVYVRVYI